MAYIRRLKHLKHLEINISSVSSYLSALKHDFGVLGVNQMDDNACKRLTRFFESGLDSISLHSLHIKIGEWENAKWTTKTYYPRNDPMVIGERGPSGGMHFYRIYPPDRRRKTLDPHMNAYPQDLYRSLLVNHGFDDPGFMDSSKFTRVGSDSGWGTLS